MQLWHHFRALPPALAALLIADVAINVGFWMLVPFISVHVHDNLGMTATVAGLVLAVRMMTQQFCQVLAGPTADLFGYKRILLIGLLIRAIGFASFAVMSNLSGLLLSAVLSAIGGALFSSAERGAFAALTSGPDQATKFAMLNTAQAVGTTAGPLLGALLLAFDFRLLSVVAGAVYLPVVYLVWRTLPDLRSGKVRPAAAGAAVGEVFHSIWLVAQNRFFLLYCLITAGFWTISGQINISLALYAMNLTGNPTAVKYLYTINALLTIALQFKLSQWVARRWPPLTVWSIGTAIAGLSFLLLIPFQHMAGLIACAVTLGLGSMLVKPTDQALVVRMAPRDSVAGYFGFSSLAVALGGGLGQLLGGALTDLAVAAGAHWLPWASFASVGIVTAATMYWFGRDLR